MISSLRDNEREFHEKSAAFSKTEEQLTVTMQVCTNQLISLMHNILCNDWATFRAIIRLKLFVQFSRR